MLTRKCLLSLRKIIVCDESQAGFELPCWNTLFRYSIIIWVIKEWEWYCVFNPYVMKEVQRFRATCLLTGQYDTDEYGTIAGVIYIIGLIDLTDKGIGVRHSFLYWAFRAWWINYNIDEQKSWLTEFPFAESNP